VIGVVESGMDVVDRIAEAAADERRAPSNGGHEGAGLPSPPAPFAGPPWETTETPPPEVAAREGRTYRSRTAGPRFRLLERPQSGSFGRNVEKIEFLGPSGEILRSVDRLPPMTESSHNTQVLVSPAATALRSWSGRPPGWSCASSTRRGASSGPPRTRGRLGRLDGEGRVPPRRRLPGVLPGQRGGVVEDRQDRRLGLEGQGPRSAAAAPAYGFAWFPRALPRESRHDQDQRYVAVTLSDLTKKSYRVVLLDPESGTVVWERERRVPGTVDVRWVFPDPAWCSWPRRTPSCKPSISRGGRFGESAGSGRVGPADRAGEARTSENSLGLQARAFPGGPLPVSCPCPGAGRSSTGHRGPGGGRPALREMSR